MDSLSAAHKIAPKSTKFRYKPAPEPAPEFAFGCGFSIRSAWLNARFWFQIKQRLTARPISRCSARSRTRPLHPRRGVGRFASVGALPHQDQCRAVQIVNNRLLIPETIEFATSSGKSLGSFPSSLSMAASAVLRNSSKIEVTSSSPMPARFAV